MVASQDGDRVLRSLSDLRTSVSQDTPRCLRLARCPETRECLETRAISGHGRHLETLGPLSQDSSRLSQDTSVSRHLAAVSRYVCLKIALSCLKIGVSQEMGGEYLEI